MTWIKLDNGFPDNPKIVSLTLEAKWLYVQGLCYSNRYLTDGVIVKAAAARMEGWQAYEELIAAGLWELDGAQILILNYTEYQTPKAEIERKKTQIRERSEKYRKRVTRESRVTKTSRQSVTHALVTPTDTDTDTDIKDTSNKFDAFWEIYPRKVGKQEAVKAYSRSLACATADEIIAGASRFAADPNREAAFTPHPATWLNQGRWEDDPLPVKTAAGGFRGAISTSPTWTPPQYIPEARETAPMPENIRALLSGVSRTSQIT